MDVLLIVSSGVAVASIFVTTYYIEKALENLKQQRSYVGRYLFFFTHWDALYNSKYYTDKGNYYRKKWLISLLICLLLFATIIGTFFLIAKTSILPK